jgi:hypothetical protein
MSKDNMEELVGRGVELLTMNIDGNYEYLEQERQAARDAEAVIEKRLIHLSNLKNALLKAQALADMGAFPVGARVQHYHFKECFGTIVQGSQGVAVKQDSSDEVSDGFTAAEWVLS